eukprot:g1123.t1
MSSTSPKKREKLSEMLKGYPLTLAMHTSWDTLRHLHKSRLEHEDMLERCTTQVDLELKPDIVRQWDRMRRVKDNFPNMEKKYPNISFPLTVRAHNTHDRLEHWARQIETQEQLIADAQPRVNSHIGEHVKFMQRLYASKRRKQQHGSGLGLPRPRAGHGTAVATTAT